MVKNVKKSEGKISTILLVLAMLLVVIIIVIFIIVKINATRTSSAPKVTTPVSSAPPPPVTDVTIGNVKFTFISAQDFGSDLPSPKPGYISDLTTTGRIIEVTIGAQNIGKTNTASQAWGIGNIVDSDGRNYISVNDTAYSYLPNPNLCGSILYPAFDPTPCVGFYEISNVSKGLKIAVTAPIAGSTKEKEAYIDLVSLN